MTRTNSKQELVYSGPPADPLAPPTAPVTACSSLLTTLEASWASPWVAGGWQGDLGYQGDVEGGVVGGGLHEPVDEEPLRLHQGRHSAGCSRGQRGAVALAGGQVMDLWSSASES